MRRQTGLTLVELLVSLAILGVLVGVVFPGFQNIVARNSLATSANGVLVAISYARSEAVREGGGVVLAALDTSDAANEWGPGFEVRSADATVLRIFEPVPGDLTLDSVDDLATLTFTGQGAPIGGATSFNLCLAGDSGVQIEIAATGRASTSPLVAADCP